jgi:hypothetical protein
MSRRTKKQAFQRVLAHWRPGQNTGLLVIWAERVGSRFPQPTWRQVRQMSGEVAKLRQYAWRAMQEAIEEITGDRPEHLI